MKIEKRSTPDGNILRSEKVRKKEEGSVKRMKKGFKSRPCIKS